MIKALELRIDNYVFDCDGDVLQIDEIYRDYVKFKHTSLRNRYKKIKPIPLTEEWLVRCGFKQTLNEYWFEKDIVSLNTIGTICIQGRKLSEATINTPIKTVHQLQNFYFSLLGKELEINY